MTRYVQISPTNKIITVYGCAQDPSDKPGYAEIPDDSPLWSAYLWGQDMGLLRAERDKRLTIATAILDRHRNQRDFGLPTTLTDEQASAWASYAQTLRDLPENTADPVNPVWPVAP